MLYKVTLNVFNSTIKELHHKSDSRKHFDCISIRWHLTFIGLYCLPQRTGNSVQINK